MDMQHGNSSSADGSRPATANATAGTIPPRPTAAEVEGCINTLLQSVKVVAATDCRAHPSRGLCDCPAAVGPLRAQDIHHCKWNYFVRIWDSRLIFNDHNAHSFDYNGDQASHHAFTAAAGKTPKYFARDFLQKDAPAQIFAPSGKLKDTVQALLDYWIIRNAYWKHKYSTLEETKAKYVDDQYDMSDMSSFAVDLMDSSLVKETGGIMMAHGFEYGPAGHQCEIMLMPYGEVDGRFSAKIQKIQKCHDPCAIADPLHYRAFEHAFSDLAARFGSSVDVNNDLEIFENEEDLRKFEKAKQAIQEAVGDETIGQCAATRQLIKLMADIGFGGDGHAE